ncbi:MBL fold metallo-hydrolase [Candidatus Poriferisocius sp.]|uniref:MBL fold metallo-hydrolase n=1 Tax=Candidatus Poriferisocius sp. TaxID=3101276 RepID=UPI003B0272EF
MALSITVLGCSGSYSGPGMACTGYLVTSPGARVWLDTGPGTMANLQRHCDLADLDAVVITHQHADHWTDLALAFTAFRHYVGDKRLPVYGTAGTRSMACALLGKDDLAPIFDWRRISSEDRMSIADQQWRFSRTDHPVETLAPRVDCGGRSFAFSADTAPGWSFEQLGRGIHLALCEATFTEADRHPDAPHLSARQAGAMAAAAGVEKLLLTHLIPGSDAGAMAREASESFGQPVDVAKQDWIYQV